MARNAEELLFDAARFVDGDSGSPGLLDRFSAAVHGDAELLGGALEQALSARARAGDIELRLEPGDLRVETTSSGASLTACVLAVAPGALAASVRLTDAHGRPVAGAVLRVTTGAGQQVQVTDPGGQAAINGAGSSLLILIGAPGRRGASGRDGGRFIAFPRRRRRDQLDLAAAHGLSAPDEQEAEPWRWRVELAGAEFWGMERRDGYDLTVMVSGMPPSPPGTHAVGFVTRNREGRSHQWFVPLAPGPRAYAGSLYGTEEDGLDGESVAVGDAVELLGSLADRSGDVIRRSVRHADTSTAWRALGRRLGPGPLGENVAAALAERETSA